MLIVPLTHYVYNIFHSKLVQKALETYKERQKKNNDVRKMETHYSKSMENGHRYRSKQMQIRWVPR